MSAVILELVNLLSEELREILVIMSGSIRKLTNDTNMVPVSSAHSVPFSIEIDFAFKNLEKLMELNHRSGSSELMILKYYADIRASLCNVSMGIDILEHDVVLDKRISQVLHQLSAACDIAYCVFDDIFTLQKIRSGQQAFSCNASIASAGNLLEGCLTPFKRQMDSRWKGSGYRLPGINGMRIQLECADSIESDVLVDEHIIKVAFRSIIRHIFRNSDQGNHLIVSTKIEKQNIEKRCTRFSSPSLISLKDKAVSFSRLATWRLGYKNIASKETLGTTSALSLNSLKNNQRGGLERNLCISFRLVDDIGRLSTTMPSASCLALLPSVLVPDLSEKVRSLVEKSWRSPNIWFAREVIEQHSGSVKIVPHIDSSEIFLEVVCQLPCISENDCKVKFLPASKLQPYSSPAVIRNIDATTTARMTTITNANHDETTIFVKDKESASIGATPTESPKHSLTSTSMCRLVYSMIDQSSSSSTRDDESPRRIRRPSLSSVAPSPFPIMRDSNACNV